MIAEAVKRRPANDRRDELAPTLHSDFDGFGSGPPMREVRSAGRRKRGASVGRDGTAWLG
jgi:hypothetical protein